MDALLESLHNVSLVLLPIVGVVCLILVAMILYRIYVITKKLPVTLEKVDGVIDSAQKSVDQLEAPLNTLKNVSGTVDMVNNSAIGIASKAVSMSMKHSDAIVSWFKDFGDKRRNNKEETGNQEKEEDFGIYE